jgi:broad specificity phosphatase PhoE
MNLHTSPRPVYIIRHGESEFNVKGLIGGGKFDGITDELSLSQNGDMFWNP